MNYKHLNQKNFEIITQFINLHHLDLKYYHITNNLKYRNFSLKEIISQRTS